MSTLTEKLRVFADALGEGLSMREAGQMLRMPEAELKGWLEAHAAKTEPIYSALEAAFIRGAESKLTVLRHLNQSARTRPRLALRLAALRPNLDAERADILSENPDPAGTGAKQLETRTKILAALAMSSRSPDRD